MGLRCLFDSIGLKETDVGLSGTGAGAAVDGEADPNMLSQQLIVLTASHHQI